MLYMSIDSKTEMGCRNACKEHTSDTKGYPSYADFSKCYPCSNYYTIDNYRVGDTFMIGH